MSLSVSHAPAEWREVFAGAQARGSVLNLLDWLIVLRRLRVGRLEPFMSQNTPAGGRGHCQLESAAAGRTSRSKSIHDGLRPIAA